MFWPFSTIRDLRNQVKAWEERYDRAKVYADDLTNTITDLEAQLQQARKNDPPRGKDGRFKKIAS